MLQRDVFQDIADNRIQVTEKHCEIPPVDKNDRLFEKSDKPFPYKEVYFRQEVSYEERLSAFEKEL